MTSGGISGAALNSLWNNPQLLQQAFPSINVQGLQGVLEAELTQAAAPVQQLAQEQNTLSAQAKAYSAIQQALGTVLNDVQALSTASAFTQTGAPVSSDPSLVTASGTGAPAGTYSVAVNALEQNAVLTSSVVSQGSSTALGWSGSITFAVGPSGSQTAVTVQVGTGDTLSTIAQNLNAAAAQSLPAGETLSAITLPTTGGSQLVVSVNGALTPSQVTLTGTFPGLSFSQGQTYQAASYAVDGVANTANSNTIQDALPGVTLNLLGTTPAGSPVTLQVSANPSATANQVQTLVNDIQTAVTTINQYTAQGQPLAGDASLGIVAGQMIQALTGVNTGQPVGYQSLTSMGLTMSYTQGQGGSLSFNAAAFTQALTQNPGAVTALFTQAGSGIASQLQQFVGAFANPSGILSADQQNIQNQEQQLSNEEAAVQALVDQEQQQLQAQFMANLQTLVNNAAQLQFIQAYVAQQSGSASGSSSGQGGTVG